MTQFKNLYLKGAGPILKPVVQKRDSKDSAGYISKEMVPLYFRFLSWIFSQEAKDTREFSRRILKLWDTNGQAFVVKYLKEAFLLTQKYLSGEEVKVTKTLPFSLVGGLPRFIPGPFRKKLREKDPSVIRFVLTSLAVFRIIKCPGTLKTSTITDPFKGDSEVLMDYEVSQALISVFGRNKLTFSSPKWLFLMSAGPNSSVSWKGIWLDIRTWSGHSLLPQLKKFISSVGWEETDFVKSLYKEIELVKDLTPSNKSKDLVLGRLSEKEEAAGKIRVFAITDSVTQALFKPIHDSLFSRLKSLETDGTFDQVKPLIRLLELKSSGILGSNKFWSYDLSAATDRLPSKLQAQILRLWARNNDLGDLWRELLVSRDWSGLRYSVGQPMGALSSWGMLAVTQHICVAIAARRVGIKGFDHYAVLGDDIVIANDLVAHSYHSLMVETLGVEINLSKSLVSYTHFEYAKRLVSVDGEFTPIGPKNLLILLRSPYGLVSVFRDAISKGYFLDEKSWESMRPKLPFYSKRAQDSLNWLIKGPFGLVPTESGLSTKLRLDNSLNPVMIDMILSSIDHTKHSINLAKWFNEVGEFKHIVFEFENGKMPLGLLNPDGTDYCLEHSHLYFPLREILLEKQNRFIEEKPVRRYIYDGPLVMTNHYRADWLPTCMSYIRSKVMEWESLVPASNPFKDINDLATTRDHNRGRVFFRKVQADLLDRISILRQRYSN